MAAELALALTLITIARNEYRYGDVPRGDLAKRKAVHACAEVERWVDNAEARGNTMRELRSRLGRLQAELASADQGQRKRT